MNSQNAGFRKQSRRAPRTAGRRAVVMAAVIAGLVVVFLMISVLMRCMILHQRQHRKHEQQLQALWLVESGMSRALAELSADPQFQGTQWRVPGPDAQSSGWIQIEVEPGDGSARVVTVEAHWPEAVAQRVVRRQQRIVPLPAQDEAP